MFSILYGIWPAMRSSLVFLAVAGSEAGFAYSEAFITYLMPARAGSDEFFGDAGLERVVRRLAGSGGVSDVVLAAYREWIGDATPLADNATLVAVERV